LHNLFESSAGLVFLFIRFRQLYILILSGTWFSFSLLFSNYGWKTQEVGRQVTSTTLNPIIAKAAEKDRKEKGGYVNEHVKN
jgi:hypothetical protein